MLRAFSLTVVLSFALSAIAPRATSQNCYMQGPDGKITHFSFCDSRPTPPGKTTQNSGISQPVKPVKSAGRVVLYVSDLNYVGDWLVGRVTNAGDQEVDRVRVYWETLDRFGSVVGADLSCTSPPRILPGQTVTFRDFVYPEGFTVRTTAIAWGSEGAITSSLFPALHSRTFHRRQSLVEVFKTNQLKLAQCSLYS